VPDQVRELAPEIGLRREAQELDLGRVDVAIRPFDRRPTHSGAKALERPRDPVIALALGGELGRVEMLVDRLERLERVGVRGVIEEVMSQEAVLGDASQRLLSPGRSCGTADRELRGVRNATLRPVSPSARVPWRFG
jgi:hypothetical protein